MQYMCFVFSEGGELQAPAMFSAFRRRRAVFCVLIRRRATSARHVFCSQKEESYSPPAMFSVLGRRRATSARRVFCSQEESCVLCSQKEESYKQSAAFVFCPQRARATSACRTCVTAPSSCSRRSTRACGAATSTGCSASNVISTIRRRNY